MNVVSRLEWNMTDYWRLKAVKTIGLVLVFSQVFNKLCICLSVEPSKVWRRNGSKVDGLNVSLSLVCNKFCIQLSVVRHNAMVRRCNGKKVDGLDISLFRRSQVCTTTLLSFRTKAKLRLKTPPARVASKRYSTFAGPMETREQGGQLAQPPPPLSCSPDFGINITSLNMTRPIS